MQEVAVNHDSQPNIGIKVLHKVITLTGKLIANKLFISKC